MTTAIKNKPSSVRAVFILSGLIVIIAFIFFLVFSFTDLRIGDIGARDILYTLIAYVLNFLGVMFSILKRKIGLLRLFLLLTIVASIPLRGVIAMVLAIAALLISFSSKTLKEYFQ